AERARARFDSGAAALGGGLIGSRFAYILLHLEFYRIHPAEMLAYWQGGLDWLGGSLGAVIGLWVYARAARQPFWQLADSLAAPGMLFSLAAWLGCFLDGCGYGRPVASRWWAPATPDSFGTVAPRLPTQAAGALLTLTCAAALFKTRDRPMAAGARACLALAACASIILLVSLGRGDPSVAVFGLRGDAVASAFVLVASLAAWRLLPRLPEAA
ncbi:MAG: prolipoprotein diacylglyceryl transferase, partial [Anaerolineales bacterium]